jgi:anti-sigma factor RsiW
MTTPSFRDMEQISAYLDGQISRSERTRLENRVKSDPALAAALKELRQTRKLLRSMHHMRAPRNFTLTPKMVGLRPPTPRVVPALSWASAVAMVLFVCTLGTNLLGGFPLGASAPMMAAAPSGYGGGPAADATMELAMAEPATEAPVMGAPATEAPVMAAPATMAPAIAAPTTMALATEDIAPKTSATERTEDQTVQVTPTAEVLVMAVPEAAQPATNDAVEPPSVPDTQPHKPFNTWLIFWPALGILLGALALLVRWLNQRAFRRKNLRR